MSKKWMREAVVVCSKAVALGTLGTGMAQADGLYSAAATIQGYGVPADFSLLVWAPLLVLALACAGGLLWLIHSDSTQGRVRAPADARPRQRAFLPCRRLAHP